MPLTISTYASTDALDAQGVMDRLAEVEGYLNGGIEAGDLGSGSAFVDSGLLRRQDVFGAPHPRIWQPANDTIYRFFGNEAPDRFLIYYDVLPGEYLAIPGLSAPLHVQPSPAGETPYLEVLADFHAWESKGKSSPVTKGDETETCASFGLFFNESRIEHSDRSLPPNANSGNGRLYWTGKNHHMSYFSSSVAQIASNPGTHSLSVRVKPLKPTPDRDWLHIWVGARTLVASVRYL